MKTIPIIAAALALGVPAAAYAAADCRTGMTCCKDSADCCKDGKADCCQGKQTGRDRTGHDRPGDQGRTPVQPR